jgi:CheY-like chemotaxis protein
MPTKELTILLVEDDEIDVDMTKRAFKNARVANPIVTADNGEDALKKLRSEGEVPRPFIILLDLNMPKMNGLEFLEHLRADEQLASSVVFVLTTSDADRDRWAAYDKQVAGYILKDNVGEGFMNLIGLLDHYWRIVELPNEKSDSF